MASFHQFGLEQGAVHAQRRAIDLQHVQWYLGAEPSDSSEGSDSPRQGSSRPYVWVAALGALLIVCAFFMKLLGPDEAQLRGAASGQAAQTRVSDDFGEKVLVVEQPSAAPWAAHVGVPWTNTMSRSTSTPNPLLPAEDLHDGNVCRDDEELLSGLCYKKCSLLTNGTDSIRTSPWTCCESTPCLTNQKLSVDVTVACTGYDVGGDGACPHKPGSCLADEELFLGVCYKKCSLLTDEDYPHRVSPMTCCQEGGLSCLDFRKDYTSKEFAVGGGEDGAPGACDEDEELFLGLCYKRCTVLTHADYPLRVAAATCCRANTVLPHKVGGRWHLGCLDFRKDKTSAAFNMAKRPRNHASALEQAHYPLESLTEVGNETPVLLA